MRRDVAARCGRLTGQVAIVTGGSSGIGQAACFALAREGARVVVAARDRARVDQTVSEVLRACGDGEGLPAALGLAPVDVRDERDVERMVQTTVDRFGRIDILVASAAIGKSQGSSGFSPTPVLRLGSDAWDEIIDTNLKGLFLTVRAVLPTMMGQGSGQIVSIGSARAGGRGQPYASAYCASKFGLLGLCEALREEACRFGIRVHVVAPGAVDTPLIRGTGLARHGAIQADAVGEFIADLVALPEDTVLVAPFIGPFASEGTA